MRFARILPAALAAMLALPALAWAGSQHPFTEQAFHAAQAKDQPIVVFVEASWCPTCAQQRPILAKLLTQPAFRDLVVYDVDFDRQKAVVRQMGVTMQSSFIVFHGRTLEGRSTGDTNAASIRALLERANG